MSSFDKKAHFNILFALFKWAFVHFCIFAGVYEHIRNQVSYSKHEPYFDVSTQRNVSSVSRYTNIQIDKYTNI